MVFLFVCLFLLSLYLYISEKHLWVLISITFYLTNGFSLVPEGLFGAKPTDYVLALTVFITLFRMNKNYFKIRKDKFVLLFIVLFFYQLLELIRTILFKYESTIFAIQVARINIIYLLYFYIRSLPYSVIKKYFEYNLLITIFVGILFYLQLVGITGLLVGRFNAATAELRYTRYANFPQFALFYFFYALANKSYSISKRIFYCLFFGAMPVLGMYRSFIIAMGSATLVFFIYTKGLRSIPVLIVGTMLFFVELTPVFEARSQQNGSALNDIENVYQSDFQDIDKSEGTFSFRIAMLSERVFYLMNHSDYLFLGVGDIHEQSPNCYKRFRFQIGTKSLLKHLDRGQLETGDITWVPLLMRNGILGLFIYIILFLLWGILSFKVLKKTHSEIAIASSMMFVVFLFLSFNTTFFENYLRIFMMILSIVVLTKKNDCKTKLIK